MFLRKGPFDYIYVLRNKRSIALFFDQKKNTRRKCFLPLRPAPPPVIEFDGKERHFGRRFFVVGSMTGQPTPPNVPPLRNQGLTWPYGVRAKKPPRFFSWVWTAIQHENYGKNAPLEAILQACNLLDKNIGSDGPITNLRESFWEPIPWHPTLTIKCR